MSPPMSPSAVFEEAPEVEAALSANSDRPAGDNRGLGADETYCILSILADANEAAVVVRKVSERDRSEHVLVDFEVKTEEKTKIAHTEYLNGFDDDNRYPFNEEHMESIKDMSFRDVSDWEIEEGDYGGPCRTFTLYSWIEYSTYEEFPNRDRLLQLLEHAKALEVDDGLPGSKKGDSVVLAGSSVSNWLDQTKPSSATGNEYGSFPDTEDGALGGSSHLLKSHLRSQYTPSSVFGVLLFVFILMVVVETVT
ncbi:hypothetical protein V8F33_013641 [Rhypophila sp. PSN 637]